MRRPSQITQRDIDLAAQRADREHGLLAIPQPKAPHPREPMYAVLAVAVLALAGLIGLRYAPIRFVGAHCDPSVQVCK